MIIVVGRTIAGLTNCDLGAECQAVPAFIFSQAAWKEAADQAQPKMLGPVTLIRQNYLSVLTCTNLL